MARLTRTLATSAVFALATTGTLAGPAQAHGRHHDHDGGRGLFLTRSAAATLDKYDVDLDWSRSSDRYRHHHHHGSALRGTLVFDGANTVRWADLRVNNRRNRVTAIVGGERRAVLRFRDARGDRYGHHHDVDGRRSALRLTRVGAASIDSAAGADAFDAGDAFARARGCH